MSKVLITPRSLTRDGHPALDRLRDAGFEVVMGPPGRQPTEEELMRLTAGVSGWLAGVEPIGARVLEAAAELRVIARNGVGIDNIDTDAARRLNITIQRAPGANARGVAELAIALMFSLARAIPAGDRAIKAARWQRTVGTELCGATLGVVGCGTIGRQVIEMALGLGMRVLGYDVAPDASHQPGRCFEYTTLDDMLTRSDVVMLHCPAREDGTPILDAPTIARMKRGVRIINTARHSLIDTAALADAIQSGHVAGAALDVFDIEPPVVDQLLADDRVIATPHIGGYTRQSVDRAVSMAVEGLLKTLAKVEA
jgi:phosphoglycerate dehydrogenase-like enzyme